MSRARTLSRDVEATLVPQGQRITLESGTTILVGQALGGSFTGTTDLGYMVRIEGRDANAIGEDPPQTSAAADRSDKSVRDLVWDQLKTCYDPEIPVDIVELGLVYSCEVSELPDGGHKAAIGFTLTAPGCVMGEFIREDVRRKVASVPGVKEAARV
jgi:probable FeS assembly SUF system protein SufT